MSKSLYRNLVTVPNASTDSLNDGETVGGDIIKNDKALADKILSVESAKQDTLVSGTNIKTINSTSLLGSGDIALPAGADGATIFAGTAVTGTGTSISATVSGSKANDIYINRSTGNIYQASAADLWDYLLSIKAEYSVSQVTGTTPSVSLSHGSFYDCTSTGITALTISASSFSDTGNCATVTFQSPATAPTFTGPESCYFKGDDTVAGVFTPTASKYYSLDFRQLPNTLSCVVVGY